MMTTSTGNDDDDDDDNDRYCITFKHKKVPLIFSPQLLQISTDFHNISCTTSPENGKVIGIRISCHTFVMLLPYRVKVSDTNVTHFTQY